MPAITVMEDDDLDYQPTLKAVQGRQKVVRQYRKKGQSGLMKQVQKLFRLALIMIPLLACLYGGVIGSMEAWHWWSGDIAHLPEGDPNVFVYDHSGQLSVETQQSLSERLKKLSRHTAADWRLVVVNNTDQETLQAKANQLLSEWQVGRATVDQRAAMILVTEAPVKIAFSLTPNLESTLGVNWGPNRTYMGFTHLKDLLAHYPWDQQMETGGLTLGLHEVMTLLEKVSGVNQVDLRISPFDVPDQLRYLMEAEVAGEIPANQKQTSASTALPHAQMTLPASDAEANTPSETAQ
jgi:hypothetical protein